MAFTLGIDLDGCYARGFVTQFRSWLISRGFAPGSLPATPNGDYDLPTQWGIPVDLFVAEMGAAAAADSIYVDAVPDPAGARVLRRLHRRGIRLHVVTARSEPSAHAITRDWLLRTRTPFDRLTCTRRKHLVDDVDLLVDDSPANVEACLDHGKPAVLLDRPWNTNATGLPRLPGWDALPGHLPTSHEPLPNAVH